jgi:hypothetical protein
MRLVIDTDKEFPQLTEDIRQLFLALREKFGWNGLARLLQEPVVELNSEDEPADLQPLVTRLRRICQALEATEQASG